MKIKLECCHAGTCLPDYWGGHHKAHIAIPVYHGMTLKAIKQSLMSELSQGAIAGSEYELTQTDAWYTAAKAAVNCIKPNKKGQRRFFTDLEKDIDDDCYSVYAYFVFMPME